jgi:hypothetical protein
MDGDDIALPVRLEKQLRFLENNLDIVLVGCATSAIDERGRPVPGLGVSLKPITQEVISSTLLLAPPCSHIWLARREVYDKLSGYREIPVAEDYDFLLRAITAGFLHNKPTNALMLIRNAPAIYSSRLEQRKAHYYIANLYRERMRNGQDSFSREGYERAVNTGRLENGVFRLAMKCVRRGLLSHSRALRYMSSGDFLPLVSPWQARYFLLRLRLKMALRTQGYQVLTLARSNNARDRVMPEAVMKICFIIHNITARAGSERAQASLANALSARGESISIWSMYGAGKTSGFPLKSRRQGELWPQETVAVLSGLSVAGLRLSLLCDPVAAKMDCVHGSQQVDCGFASGICARRRGGYMGAFSGFQ